jgi:hypothetical protein
VSGLSGLGTRVLLVGTGKHEPGSHLPDVPTVTDTVADLGRCLVERCGLPETGLRTMVDPDDPIMFDRAVRAAAGEATDVLLVYYVGHGQPAPDGELHLATSATVDLIQPPAPHYQALPYRTLRDVVSDSRARTVVVILDCCFSGRASAALVTGTDDVYAMASVRDSFLLTAASRDGTALAPPDERHTAFTGALLKLLADGDPVGPPRITLDHAYRHLAQALPASGRPEPRRTVSGRAGDLPLTDNRAYRRPAPLGRRPDPGRAGDQVCPYRGLEAYGPGDARYFFGRERLTATLLARLADRVAEPRPLFVVGASGAGKSSLLRAGLVARLRAGDLPLPGSWEWPTYLFTPGRAPIAQLAAALGPHAGVRPRDARAVLVRDPASAARLARAALDAELPAGGGTPATHWTPDVRRAVVVVDQFEELFTPEVGEADRHGFVHALVAASAVHPGLGEPAALVVVGLRADFYGRATEYPALAAALADGQVVVGPMSRDELDDAIRRPAREAGLEVEDDLVELLLRDLDVTTNPTGAPARPHPAGVLPLLSHALLATWQRREGRVLTANGYIATGGVHRAVATTAENVYAALDDAGQNIARRLLLGLVHVSPDGTDDARRRRDLPDLLAEHPDPDRARKVVDAFAAGKVRLLTVDHDPASGQDTAQISHEALLRAWPTLRSWVDDDRESLLVAQRLIDDARSWHDNDRDPDLLYRGTRLAVARDWAAAGSRTKLSPTTQAYLTASMADADARVYAERRRARRNRLFTAVVVVLLVLSLAAGGTAVHQWRQADDQRRAATARGLLAEADAARDRDPRTALQLALAAGRVDAGLAGAARGSLLATLENHL